MLEVLCMWMRWVQLFFYEDVCWVLTFLVFFAEFGVRFSFQCSILLWSDCNPGNSYLGF